MGHPVHFLKSCSIFPSNFSAVPGDDDRAVLHPGGQPLVQVLLEVLHQGDRGHQEGQQERPHLRLAHILNY